MRADHHCRFGKARLAWLVLCVLAGGATGGYFGYYLPYHSREQEALRQVETLKRVVERLSSERRIAEVVVVDQQIDPQTGAPVKTLRFVEYNRRGNAMPHRYFRTIGREVYFDALVIKFQDTLVAEGDALRGKSIYLFRRVFGNRQAPDEGAPIDDTQTSAASIPSVYRVDENPNPYELRLWNNFWRYANDPTAAAEMGVRVLQGEAVYARMEPGRLYHLKIEADGGINILPGPIPPALAPERGSPPSP